MRPEWRMCLQVVGDGKPKNAKLEFLKKYLQPENE